MSNTYPHKLSWACWVLCTVFCNQGAVAQHGNLTQNWIFLDLVVHCQALRSGDNKEVIVGPRSHFTEIFQKTSRVDLPPQA